MSRTRALARRRQSGQAIVLIALMMSVLLGFAALGIDSARAFQQRHDLQTAVDTAALYAADSYAVTADWSGAVNKGAGLLGEQLRLYTHSCGAVTAPTRGGASQSVACYFAPATSASCPLGAVTSGVAVCVTLTDKGQQGQSFVFTAAGAVTVALMQVVGLSPRIQVSSSAAAVSGDLAHSPTVQVLSSSGCGGSGSPALNVASSNGLTVAGDLVLAGTAALGGNMTLAGDLVSRCQASVGGLGFGSYPYGCTSNCTTGQVLYPRAIPDPGYPAPVTSGSPQTPGGANVTLNPGTYTGTTLSNSYCYFLAPGVYQVSGNLALQGGLFSNQLKPPAEGSLTAGAPTFWSSGGSASCGGGSLSATDTLGLLNGIATGTYGIEVTSMRTETVGGQSYSRESYPSKCLSYSHFGGVLVISNGIQLTIPNAPGATSYGIYLAPGGCAGTFGYVGSVANSTAEVQGNLGTTTINLCGQVVGCSGPGNLNINGWSNGTCTAAAPPALNTCPPDGALASYKSDPTLPNQNPARALAAGNAYPKGGRANANACATAASAPNGTNCPATQSAAATTSFVTPGAVEIYMNGGCLTVSGGADVYLFSGYQYDWVVVHQAAACATTLQGQANTAFEGLLYMPSTALTISGSNVFQSPSFGGLVCSTLAINGFKGTTPLIPYAPAYAPIPAGARLAG